MILDNIVIKNLTINKTGKSKDTHLLSNKDKNVAHTPFRVPNPTSTH